MCRSYKKMIAQLGMTQVGAAKFLGISERQSRRLAAGERELERGHLMLLSLMCDRQITPQQACQHARIRWQIFDDMRFKDDE